MAEAAKKSQPKPQQTSITLGCIEFVSMPELGILDEIAKIDTGAFSGAVHCTNIRVVRRGILRKRILKFTPLGDEKLATETTKFERKEVRSASGHAQKRYIIQTTVEIAGGTYPITIGLTDRSELTRSILIGRRFIRENNMLVDVRINQEHDHEGDINA